jgi:hypothetical protein
MGFLGRWISDSIRFGLALAFALGAMQAPALTDAYADALLQVAATSRRDLEERKQIAIRHYGWQADGSDAAVMAQLQPVEPANAAGLQATLAREALARDTHAALMGHNGLTRPVHAAWSLADDPQGERRAVMRVVLDNYEPAVRLGLTDAVYGFLGLTSGLLLGALIVAPFGPRRQRYAPSRS